MPSENKLDLKWNKRTREQVASKISIAIGSKLSEGQASKGLPARSRRVCCKLLGSSCHVHQQETGQAWMKQTQKALFTPTPTKVCYVSFAQVSSKHTCILVMLAMFVVYRNGTRILHGVPWPESQSGFHHCHRPLSPQLHSFNPFCSQWPSVSLFFGSAIESFRTTVVSGKTTSLSLTFGKESCPSRKLWRA